MPIPYTVPYRSIAPLFPRTERAPQHRGESKRPSGPRPPTGGTLRTRTRTRTGPSISVGRLYPPQGITGPFVQTSRVGLFFFFFFSAPVFPSPTAVPCDGFRKPKIASDRSSARGTGFAVPDSVFKSVGRENPAHEGSREMRFRTRTSDSTTRGSKSVILMYKIFYNGLTTNRQV